MTFDQWVSDLDSRCVEFVTARELYSGGTLDKNARALEGLFALRKRHCANPFCHWMLDDERVEYHAYGFGDVCAVCHSMFQAVGVLNLGLRDSHYFKLAHEKWKKEQESAAKLAKERKKRMGMDEDES